MLLSFSWKVQVEIPKAAFSYYWQNVLQAEKGWTKRIGSERHLICIEDPFDTSHDLGRVVDRFSIKTLRDEFKRAHRILRSSADPLRELFLKHEVQNGNKM